MSKVDYQIKGYHIFCGNCDTFYLLERQILQNIMNVFTVTFDQFNVSLLNERVLSKNSLNDSVYKLFYNIYYELHLDIYYTVHAYLAYWLHICANSLSCTSSWAARPGREWALGSHHSSLAPRCPPARNWLWSSPVPQRSYSSPAGHTETHTCM